MKISKSKTVYSFMIIIVLVASFTRGFSSSVFGSAKNLMFAMTAISLLSMYYVIRKHIALIRIDLCWIVILLLNIFWVHETYPIQYCFVFLGTFCLSYALRKNIDLFGLILDCILLFSFLSVFATWMELLAPATYKALVLPLFPLETQESILIQYNQGRMCGLAYHYSPNAFYVLDGSFVLICKIFINNKRKTINFILLGIELATLFAIGKRGHLLFFAISVFIVYLFIQENFLEKIKKSIKFTALAIVAVVFILKFVPQASYLLERMAEQSESGDITTGRTVLYALAIRIFFESPFFGNKIGGFRFATGMKNSGVHNDYLQMLCETGLLGFIMYVFANIWLLVATLDIRRKYWTKLPEETKKVLVFSMMFQIFVLTYSFTGLPHFDYEINTIYLLMIAVPFAIRNKMVMSSPVCYYS